MSDSTLFERLGGGEAVNAAVDIFYQKPRKTPSFRWGI